MEGNFHVEVTHAAEDGSEARQAAAPLGPGGAVVEAEENEGDFRVPATQCFLKRVPASGVL